MKKTAILISLFGIALSISSCGGQNETTSSSIGSSSSSVQNKSAELTEEMLSSIQKGYKSQGILTTLAKTDEGYTTSSITSYNYFDYQSDSSGYSFELYKGSSSNESLSRDTTISSGYYAGYNGKAAQVILNIDNTLSYTILEDSGLTSLLKTMKFEDSGFANPFALIASTSVFKKGSKDYEFVFDTIPTTKKRHFGFGMIGSVNYTLSDFTLHTDGYKITGYDVSYSPYSASSSSKEEISISATVSDFGNAEVKKVEPLDVEPLSSLDEATASLQDHNYTCETKVYSLSDDNETLTSSYETKVNDGTICFTNTNANGVNSYFAYYDKDSLLYESCKVDGNYYQYLSGMSSSVNDILPSFDISSALFDKNGSTYSLKQILPAITPSSNAIDMFLTENISSLTISISDDVITFTNISETYKSVSAYSSIGTTNNGFASSDVKKDCSALSWKELFENQSKTYDELVSFCRSEDVVNLIPTVGSLSPYASLGINSDYREIIVPIGRDSTEAQTAVTSFTDSLYSKGWGDLEEQLSGAYETVYSSGVKVSDTLTVTPYLDLFTPYDSYGNYYLYIYVYLNL